MRKQYLIFGYEKYYPEGGFHDIIGESDDLSDACNMARSFVNITGWAFAHVVDLTMPIDKAVIYKCHDIVDEKLPEYGEYLTYESLR